MAILLTGATGFLGSHLLKALLSKTQEKVIVLKRSFSNIERIKNEINNDKVLVYNVDSCDFESIFKENSIDTVIHCATSYGRGKNNSDVVLQSNLVFPIKILEYSVKYNVKTFINTDSYFNKDNLTYPSLLNYSLSKKALLLWLKHYSKQIQVINMILEHIYGENDNKDKFVYQMFNKITNTQNIELDLTKGEQKRDFIYIDDVVNSYLCVIENTDRITNGYSNFEVGTGHATSIKDFVEEIKAVANSNIKLNFGVLPYRKEEIMCSFANNNNLKDLGWKCEYTYKTGIQKIMEKL